MAYDRRIASLLQCPDSGGKVIFSAGDVHVVFKAAVVTRAAGRPYCLDFRGELPNDTFNGPAPAVAATQP